MIPSVPPPHIHIFDEKGREIGRFDLVSQRPLDEFSLTRKLGRALEEAGFIRTEEQVMHSATLSTVATLRDCVYDAERREFLVTFQDGRLYRLLRDLLPEDDGSEVVSVQAHRDGSAFAVRQASGNAFDVPWDFVLYQLERKYPYFKDRPTQRRLENDVAVAIGRRLRALRQEMGLTADDLSRRSGIHRPNISRIESGKHIPSIDTLDRLSRALGVSMTVLVSDVSRPELAVRERTVRYRARRTIRRQPS